MAPDPPISAAYGKQTAKRLFNSFLIVVAINSFSSYRKRNFMLGLNFSSHAFPKHLRVFPI